MAEKLTWKTWPNRVLTIFEQLLWTILRVIIYLGTLPYYRLFQFNTLQPIKLIAKYTAQPDNTGKLLHLIDRWRSRKLSELHFISIAGAIISAADIGSFAWSTVPDAYWLASVFWYCSLIFAIAGIFLSSQQIGVLDLLGPLQQSNVNRSSKARIRRYLPLIGTEIRQPRFEADSQTARVGVGVWKPRWEMVFTWQCPMMFLSYSFSLYILGTTVFVCTPLINGDEWGTNSDIAAIYLATIAVSAVVFMFCSFWVYHYVDLEHDVLEDSDG